MLSSIWKPLDAGVSRERMDQLWQFGSGSQGGGWRSKGETGIPALFRRKWLKTHNALSTKKGLKITCFFPTQTIADLGPTVSLSLCCLCLSHFSHTFEEALFSWTVPGRNVSDHHLPMHDAGGLDWCLLAFIYRVMTGGNESWRVSPTSAVYVEPLYFNQSSQRYIVAWCLGHKAMMEMECNLWFLCR